MTSSCSSRGNLKLIFKSPRTIGLHPGGHASHALRSSPVANWKVTMFGPLLNSTDSTSNYGSSSLHMSATPPWCPLTAYEHMIEYLEAILGCLASTSFVSVSTANPTLICAKPAAACVNRPPPPVNNITFCHPKSPSTLRLRGRWIVIRG
jgi:hypothetical protein